MNRRRWIAGAAAILALGLWSMRGGGIEVIIGQPETRTVREYISEDAKTRLAHEYIVDMPVTGTIERIALEVGDRVEKGQLLVCVDAYDLEQRVREIRAMVAQARAHASGVDMSKPKDEDISSAQLRIQEMHDAVEVAKKARTVLEINFAESEKDFGRAKELLAAGAVSQSYLDDADNLYKSLSEDLGRARLEQEVAEKALGQAKLAYQRLAGSIDDNEYLREAYLAQAEALEAQLAVLRNNLRKLEIRAPVTGPVLEKYVEDRRVLPAGTPLLKIGDLNSIEIESDILSEEITRIAEGDPVEITGKALRGELIMGKVHRIYPSGFEKISSLGIEQQRVRTLIRFDNTQTKLLPGTSVDIRVITAQSADTLAVPERAVFRNQGQWYVFKVVGGKARKTPVTLGLRNDEWAEVREGLGAEDQIVAELKNDLEDGAKVLNLK